MLICQFIMTNLARITPSFRALVGWSFQNDLQNASNMETNHLGYHVWTTFQTRIVSCQRFRNICLCQTSTDVLYNPPMMTPDFTIGHVVDRWDRETFTPILGVGRQHSKCLGIAGGSESTGIRFFPELFQRLEPKKYDRLWGEKMMIFRISIICWFLGEPGWFSGV